MNGLQNLRWQPHWVSHLGCLEGCARYLGLDITPGWLYGGTGHAFIINMHEVVCPSGPTAWVTRSMLALGHNLGYVPESYFATADFDDMESARQQAWKVIRRALDNGYPCYGWELVIPEYYVIYGYDADGYYCRGPLHEDGYGPVPWQDLGRSDIGLIEMVQVREGEATVPEQVVSEAITFALQHAQSPSKWILPRYRAGLEGFDLWIEAVETGRAMRNGMAYNAAVWDECREMAVAFLQEAAQRMDGSLADPCKEAERYYRMVAVQLGEVRANYPFRGDLTEAPIPIDETRRETIVHLQRAREAEARALDSLRNLQHILTAVPA
jgi:hypothetical protein